MALNLNQPVHLMGPNELIAHSRQSDRQYAEAETELRKCWDSYGNLPKTEFKSILPPRSWGNAAVLSGTIGVIRGGCSCAAKAIPCPGRRQNPSLRPHPDRSFPRCGT